MNALELDEVVDDIVAKRVATAGDFGGLDDISSQNRDLFILGHNNTFKNADQDPQKSMQPLIKQSGNSYCALG